MRASALGRLRRRRLQLIYQREIRGVAFGVQAGDIRHLGDQEMGGEFGQGVVAVAARAVQVFRVVGEGVFVQAAVVQGDAQVGAAGEDALLVAFAGVVARNYLSA